MSPSSRHAGWALPPRLTLANEGVLRLTEFCQTIVGEIVVTSADSPADLRLILAKELRWFGGHGLTKMNFGRYARLLDVSCIRRYLPSSPSPADALRTLEDVLITTIRQTRQGVDAQGAIRPLEVDELKDAWLELLGLPPYRRASDFEKRRMSVNRRTAQLSLTDWRADDGPELALFVQFANRLMSPTALPEPSWLVRRSGLYYKFNADRAVETLTCTYNAEVIGESASRFGVDHRTSAQNKAGRYSLIEGSWSGCNATSKSMTDNTLQVDLHFQRPLARGSRRTLEYSLRAEVESNEQMLIRLNAQLAVWRHSLTVQFDPSTVPQRLWWFAHHVGAGVAAEPDDTERDLAISDDGSVEWDFDGLLLGPDYGFSWHW